MTEDPFVTISRALARHGKSESSRRVVSRYVALGDSFTAGSGCAPGQGWADRIAVSLGRGRPGFVYRNLSSDGATSEDVSDQVGTALQLEPDLVTVVCGANDVLRSTRPDALTYARCLTTIFRRLLGAGQGIVAVTATAPEGWDFMPVGPRTRQRIEKGMRRFNRVTRQVARMHGVACLDVAGHPGLSDPSNFAADGLHPSARGHDRAARAFAELLREHFHVPILLEGNAP